MPDITETLKRAAEILSASGVVQPRREANSLLAFALGKNQTFLIAHSEYKLSETEEMQFERILIRRADREPFQYITGRQEFFGLEFIVTPDVLIPRPETEIIVENALEILGNLQNPRFCEIGAGSGCISIAILHKLKNASAIGLDISENALKIAGKNAEKNAVADRFQLKISDVFQNLPAEKFDLLVSNPPYISSGEIKDLQPEVRDFEPHTALTDGKNGLTILEEIIKNAPNFLKPDGFLLLEIGFSQAGGLAKFFDRNLWRKLDFLTDLQGIRRTVRAQIGGGKN